uniref:Plasmodesmata callose-binding protein 5 n=1 Tax=Noccaea caerulescens TaxID=107243 RepID=A0A1J3CWT1_NOCCA
MTHRIAPRCFQMMLLCLLITSPLDVLAQGGQGDIPVVNPTSPGGSTTTPTITQPSPPSSTFPGPNTPTGGGYPPLDGTTPTGGGYPPLDGTTPTGGYPPLDGTTPIGGGGGAPVGGGGGDTGGGGGGGSGQWCIAKANASPTSLQVALDYACGYGGADCGQIQQGASCYEPNTLRDHASFAFNSYYQKHPGSDSCNFGGAAQLTSTDPSKGSCRFSASSGTVSTSPPSQPSPPDFTSPPSSTYPPPITTPTTGIPGGSGSGSGPPFGVAEPTGLPSSATSFSHSFFSIFTAVWMILMPLLREIYL